MSRLVIDGLYSKMMASSRGQKILPKPSFNMCMTMSTMDHMSPDKTNNMFLVIINFVCWSSAHFSARTMR